MSVADLIVAGMNVRLVFTDIDGVWTDGGMYYDQTGNEWKKFNTSDSAGVLFLRALEVPVVVLTGEDTAIVARRCAKLGIMHLHQGVKDKLSLARSICAELGVELDACAYIGDDLMDLALLQAVGFSGAPANAPDYVKSRVQYVTTRSGGEGAFREFVEHLIGADAMELLIRRWKLPE
jgi:3-deoxy-D-manno-octulosonate 8-phosphate phosphatase (KDO 8-P phosphatase)